MFKYSEQIDALGINCNKIKYIYSEWAKSKGINYNTLAILYEVYINNGCTQKQICEQWLVAKQTINSVCKQLSYNKIIYFDEQSSRKNKIIMLSEEGVKFAKPLIDEIRLLEIKTFELMGEEASMWFAKSSKMFYETFSGVINE